ncbi:MAG: hypothetical protein JXX14_08030 [Deltaproteobacteria bacterium]|nr:hypothetical protein [Deltaproteobacteria bacterium]
MTEFLKQLPENIEQLTERCRAHVLKRFSLELDFTSETLSVLDFFVEDLVKDENKGTRPAPGHLSRMNMVHLFAPTFGAYFGAMLSHLYGGEFRHTDKDITLWRFEFSDFFLRLNPVAVAASVIARQEVDGLSSVLRASAKQMPRLQERFDAAPEVPESDFFTFCTCLESIQIAREFLLEVYQKDGKEDCSSQNYDRILGDK